MTRFILAPIIAFALPVLLAMLGLSNALGAHHWWDKTSILIGAPIGLLAAFLLTLVWPNKVKTTLLWILLLIGAFALAKYGQTTFANSYGDDQLAGKLWYFGWIATGAGAAGAIYSALRA